MGVLAEAGRVERHAQSRTHRVATGLGTAADSASMAESVGVEPGARALPVFETGLAPQPAHLPFRVVFAEARELESHTSRCAPLSKRAQPHGRFRFRVARSAWSGWLDSLKPARSVGDGSQASRARAQRAVGMAGFEPAVSCPPDRRSCQAEPHPELLSVVNRNTCCASATVVAEAQRAAFVRRCSSPPTRRGWSCCRRAGPSSATSSASPAS